jgi:transposase
MLEASLTRAVLPRDLKLVNVRKYKTGHMWEVEKVRQTFEVCPKCGTVCTARAGRAISIVRDEPLRQNALWLKIHKHRYQCKKCKKPFTEPVSIVWPGRRTTGRFRKFIGSVCDNIVDLKRVRTLYKVSTGFVYECFYAQIEIKLRERQNRSWPEVVGIDEHFFRRVKGQGTEFVTMLTDVKKRELFEIALGKSTKALVEQLKDIPGREKVQLVVMDLSSGYRALARQLFPNAEIVADKFHVLRLPSPMIMKEGRQIHGHRQELKTRRKLLYNRPRLEYFVRQEVDTYLEQHPVLNEIYRAKERLHEIYRIKGLAKATASLDEFIGDLKTSSVADLKRLGRTLKAWFKPILNYFAHRYTNAITECLNNRGKLVQKRGYGFKSFKNYRLRVLSACLF